MRGAWPARTHVSHLKTSQQDSIMVVHYISPGDAESASMATGLAVGKPGNTFSIADSALGRSSIVTGTTAGVTQFSEVSQT